MKVVRDGFPEYTRCPLCGVPVRVTSAGVRVLAHDDSKHHRRRGRTTNPFPEVDDMRPQSRSTSTAR